MPRDDAFTLRKDRKHLWLQKVAIFILRRLGCYLVDHKATFERIEVDADKFMDRLFKQKRELFNQFNKSAVTLLIGPDEYQELMGCPEINQMFNFNAVASYHDGRRWRVAGLEVRVIPWMRGMLVMP